MEPTADIKPLLHHYLDVVEQHLDYYNLGVDRKLISPSPVTWDGGCDGQLWVRLESFTPSGSTGVNQHSTRANATPCGVPFWIATLGIGILRRISVVDNSGAAPPAEYVTEDALQQLEDMRIIKDAIIAIDTSRTLESWTPLAPQGGFSGGEWGLTVRIPNIPRYIELGNEVSDS